MSETVTTPSGRVYKREGETYVCRLADGKPYDVIDDEDDVYWLNALAAAQHELAEARKSAESFEQEAAYRAQNTDYWQGIAEQARADLAAVEAENARLTSTETVMRVIGALDEIARDVDHHAYGLPYLTHAAALIDAAQRSLLAREADDGGV